MGKDIYVAGASAQIEQVETYLAKLRAAGWSITFDWTAKVREVGNASPDDLKIRRAAAIADLKGVAGAGVLWLMQPEPTSTSTGAWVELGAAITRRDIYRAIEREGRTDPEATMPSLPQPLRDVVVVASGASKKCIFSDLADHKFESHDEAFAFITKNLGAAG
jgi:hypothetical protein